MSEPTSLGTVHEGHCIPAVLVAVGEFGCRVSNEATTRLLATHMPLGRITRTSVVEPAGDFDGSILWHTNEEESDRDPTRALDNLLSEVLDANALQAVRDAGGIVDTGDQVEVLIAVIGDCGNEHFDGILDVVLDTAASLSDRIGTAIHIVPILAISRPEASEAIPPNVRALMTESDAFSSIRPSVTVSPYVASCIREDGSHVSETDLVQALAQSLYLTLAPSQVARPFLLQYTGSPTGGNPQWRSLGVASLLVPFGAIRRSIRARLSAQLLEHTLLAPEEESASNKKSARQTGAANSLTEPALFAAAFDTVPVKADYLEGQPAVAIDPAYSSELHRNIRSTDATRWADRINDFDAAVGRIYLPEWLSTLDNNVNGFIERGRARLAEGVVSLLQTERETLHAARALLEEAKETLGAYHLQQMTVLDVERERDSWRQELDDAIQECPNPYALGARLLLAAAIGGYAFWYFLLSLRVPEQVALITSAVLAFAAVVVYFSMTLVQAEARLVQARERYLRGVSSVHSVLLLSRLSALAKFAQSNLMAAIDELTQNLDVLETSSRDIHESMKEEGNSLSLAESPTEYSIVADDDLHDLYAYQHFDLPRLALELVRWPLLDKQWRECDADTLRSRLCDFADLHATRLQSMDFEVFARRRFGDNLQQQITDQIRRLAVQSVTLAPRSLMPRLNETASVAVVTPPDEAIAGVVDRIGRDVGAHEIYREEKYCITIFRIQSLSLPVEE